MIVLVVEDMKDVRTFLKKALQPVYKVIEACEGGEALHYIKVLPKVDLVLVDWNMPGMNGYDFVKNIRSESRYDELPILMITSENKMEHVSQALAAGANEYLMKPFRTDMLYSKVRLLGLPVI